MSATIHALRVDPANEQFFAISQETEMRLRQVAEGTEAVGMMMECFDRDAGEISEAQIANVFFTIAFAIGGAIRDATFVTPTAEPAK